MAKRKPCTQCLPFGTLFPSAADRRMRVSTMNAPISPRFFQSFWFVREAEPARFSSIYLPK